MGWLPRWAGLAAAWACAAVAVAATPATLDGRVTLVTDGDSLWLTPTGGPPVEVRLLGIDAPEGCQAGGPEARRALEGMALHRDASLRTTGRDTYGRTLGTLFVDGANVNQRLVAEGHAWSMRFKGDSGPYVQQERMAQALNRGLFAVAGAQMPRDFRRNHGPCLSGEQALQPAPTPARPAAPPPPAATTAPAAATYRCDGRTRCAQMTSCAEATFFLKNCPGAAMDGDGNGVPCEQQFCGRP